MDNIIILRSRGGRKKKTEIPKKIKTKGRSAYSKGALHELWLSEPYLSGRDK